MKKIELEVPNELFEQLEKARQESGLLNLNDFVLAILQQFVDQQQPDQAAEHQQTIEKRLKDLGYL